MGRTWTTPQQNAIDARGGSLLVSAAAGSGKTAVLVERAIRLVCDADNPVDADRLLIVTFSRAAATEMKQRMGDRLAEMIHADPGNLFLQRQQALLASAQISTVHSFCLDLIRQNFQDLEISPDFSVMDQGELKILMNECLADCIAQFYTDAADEVFPELVALLSSGRDDRQLGEVIEKIYEFSRSHPFFEQWLDEKLAMYDTELPAGETVWGKVILDYARKSLVHCMGLTSSALEIIGQDEKMHKAYDAAYRSDLYQLQRCAAQVNAGLWDGAVAALSAFTFERLGALRGEDALKEQVKAAREQVRGIVKTLSEKYLNATEAQFREDLADHRPKIALLFRMVRDFSARLWEAKCAKKRLDFSDIEHLTLELLVDRSDGEVRPTACARATADRYDHIMVDEYQDTNAVQDLLFRMVSRDEANLFMVGDVKQSIYSFRQAMPEIFMEKKESFLPYGEGFPAKVALDTNFRSREEVTAAVNYLFGRLMSREMGDVEYNEEEALKPGAQFLPYGEAGPELLLVGVKEYDGDRDTVTIEAGVIAERIREMIDSGYKVEDRGELRPATLRDFCILMRSPRRRLEAYVKELAEHGIPASAENTGGYLAAREVAAMTALLRALDNPLLDVELVAAMLSPLFDFTAGDIAYIRLLAPGQPFWTALQAAKEMGNEAVAEFLRVFTLLRAEASILPADRLILRIYNLTGALAVFQAMSMGASRRANLLLLVEYAADFHRMGYKQLGGFVGFLERLVDQNGDLRPAGNLGDGANAVRVMSVHRSKGLEFPVVILADTAKPFNKVDLRQNTQLHSRYGFACVRRDHRLLKQYPTVPMQAIRLEEQRAILSEEMRILYVALTRAREKLIITGAVRTDLQRRLSGLCRSLVGGRLPGYQVGEANSYLDWVLMALLHHPAGAALRETAGRDDVEVLEDTCPWQVRIRQLQADEEAVAVLADAAPAPAADAELLQRLRALEAWRYPFEEETHVPTKLSVSAVSKEAAGIEYRFAARPQFLSRKGLTPTERGNAMHKFMQFSNYAGAQKDLEAEIRRMQDGQFLSAEECGSLHRKRLRTFFSSALARRIFASGAVHRELRFMAECGRDILGERIEGIGDSKIVVQGVADCAFLEDEYAVIVDYKTDRLAAEDLRARYARQLELYRIILSETLGVPVRECILYSFYLSEEVPVYPHFTKPEESFILEQ